MYVNHQGQEQYPREREREREREEMWKVTFAASLFFCVLFLLVYVRGAGFFVSVERAAIMPSALRLTRQSIKRWKFSR